MTGAIDRFGDGAAFVAAVAFGAGGDLVALFVPAVFGPEAVDVCLAALFLAGTALLAGAGFGAVAASRPAGAGRPERPADLSFGPCTASLSHPGARMCPST